MHIAPLTETYKTARITAKSMATGTDERRPDIQSPGRSQTHSLLRRASQTTFFASALNKNYAKLGSLCPFSQHKTAKCCESGDCRGQQLQALLVIMLDHVMLRDSQSTCDHQLSDTALTHSWPAKQTHPHPR